ncbi:MAG: DUF448 domain-containing protein [Thermosulfidibacteraceae bacterium]
MCVACRERRSKYELLRFVEKDGLLYFDPLWRSEGRGVNVCPSIRCLEIAVRKNLFCKALKKRVNYLKLEDLLKEVKLSLRKVIVDTMRLSRKFGAVTLGRTAVDKEIDIVRLLLLASDLEEGIKNYFINSGKPYRVIFTKEEWGVIFVRRPVGIVGIKDRGVADKLLRHIDRFLKIVEVVNGG